MGKVQKSIRMCIAYTFIGIAYIPFMLGIVVSGLGMKGYFYEVASWHKDYWNNVS